MSGALLEVTIRRARVLPVRGASVTPAKRVAFFAELAALGYRVKNPEAYDDSVLEHHSAIIAELTKMRGGHVPYVPLFDGFPDRVPDQHAYLADRILGYIGNLFGTFEEGVVLDSGLSVPSWLFDLKGFGADPISQLQDRGLFEAALERQAARRPDDPTHWIELELLPAAEARARLQQLLLNALYAGSSIKEALRPDLEILLEHFGVGIVELDRVRFKETRTILMRHLWIRGDAAGAVAMADTPTDLLRLFAALTGGDVSLATPITYPRLSRAQRRLILERLDGAHELAAQLKRYRNLWKAVGRGLHPGEHAERFPNAAAAFRALRNGNVVTWDTAVEVALRDRNIGAAVDRLVERPGVLGRRIHHLASIAGADRERVITAFREAAPRLTLKHLLVLDAHLRTVDEWPRRAVVNKRGTARVVPSPQHRLDGESRAALTEIVSDAIAAVIARDKGPWPGRRVWIDPALRQITVPLQQRKAADGLLTVGRGSKLPLPECRVLRLFVWWKQAQRRTDLDLSVIAYDDDLGYQGHVSWTNLADTGIVHSGDVQSAPHGAVELVDIDVELFSRAKPDARYLAPQVHRFSGDAFGHMTCFAGWMIRDKVDSSHASFDIKTVDNKLVLTGEASFALPILVDLRRRDITYIDLGVRSVAHGSTAEGASSDISTLTREMVRMADTRPNMRDLARFHVAARGAVEVADRSEADLCFGIGSGDYDALRLEHVLADLL